jgi:hypothetical protein
MTITVDIRPEVEAELGRRAALGGRPVEAIAASLLEEAVDLPSAHSALGAKNMVELFAPLRGLNLNFDRDRDPGRYIEL